MKKRKEVVAITGGCGRIGSALAEDLLKLGYKVLLGDIDIEKEDTLTLLDNYVNGMEYHDKEGIKSILKSLYVEALELV